MANSNPVHLSFLDSSQSQSQHGKVILHQKDDLPLLLRQQLLSKYWYWNIEMYWIYSHVIQSRRRPFNEQAVYDHLKRCKGRTIAPHSSKEHVATGWATACSFLLSMATVQPFKAFGWGIGLGSFKLPSAQPPRRKERSSFAMAAGLHSRARLILRHRKSARIGKSTTVGLDVTDKAAPPLLMP